MPNLQETTQKTGIFQKSTTKIALGVVGLFAIAMAAFLIINQDETANPGSTTPPALTAAQLNDVAKANGLQILQAGEMALTTEIVDDTTVAATETVALRQQKGKNILPAKKTATTTKTAALKQPNGQTIEVKSDKPTTYSFASATEPGQIIMVPTTPDVSIIQNNTTVEQAFLSNKGQPQRVIITLKQSSLGTVFKTGLSASERTSATQAFATAKDKLTTALQGKTAEITSDLQIINAVSATLSPDAYNAIKNNAVVESIVLDGVARVVLDQSIPQVGADKAWDLPAANNALLGGKGTTIAVIDTGVDYKHLDLGGCLGASCKVIGGYDFVNKDADPMDDMGHGTHVAATAAGSGLLEGIAPDANIYAYKVCNLYGSCWTSDIISALQRSVDPNQDTNPVDHVSVATLSIGGLGDPDDAMSLAVDNATAAGVTVTVAAGNSGISGASTINSPGTARTAITVAASCKTGQIGSYSECPTAIARFSSQGPLIWNGVNLNKPDVAAPGAQICAARWSTAWGIAPYSTCKDSKHVLLDGTSMATPHVAGLAALVLQANPTFTPAQVKAALKNNARTLGLSVDLQGTGEINAVPSSGVPSQVTVTPTTWILTTNPVNAQSVTTQRVTVVATASLNPAVTQLIPSFTPPITGLTFTSSKTTLTRNDAFDATIAVNNSTATPGMYRGYIELRDSGGTLHGGIAVDINIKPGLTVSPVETVDYGVVNPLGESVASENRPLVITNIRTDISQTITLSHAFPVGTAVTFTATPATVTIPAGGNTTVNTHMDVTAPVGTYQGVLTMTSGQTKSILNLNTIVKRYYTITITDSTTLEFATNAMLVIHNQADIKMTGLGIGNGGTYIALLPTAGPWDVIAHYDYRSGMFFTKRYVINENLNISTGTMSLGVNASQADKEIFLQAVDKNNVSVTYPWPQIEMLSFNGKEIYSQSVLWGGTCVDGRRTYFSTMSPSYTFDKLYQGYYGEPTTDMYYWSVHEQGLTSSKVIAKTAADFSLFTLKPGVNLPSGLVKNRTYMTPNGFSMAWGYDKTNSVSININMYAILDTLATGITQTIDPVTNVTINESTWYNPVTLAQSVGGGYIPLAPLENRSLTLGGGPVFSPMILEYEPFYPGATNKVLKVGSEYRFTFNDWTFQTSNLVLKQDGSTMPYAANFYTDYGTANQKEVTIGNPVGYYATYLGITALTPAGAHTTHYVSSYKTRTGADMSVTYDSSLDTTRTDANPPYITSVKYYANGGQTDTYNGMVDNQIKYGVHANGGTIASTKVSYSTNGTSFTDVETTKEIAQTLISGTYSATLPKITDLTTVYWRITVADNSGNTSTETVQMPVATDLTLPTSTLTAPTSGIVSPGTKVTLGATATDDSGIDRVEFYDSTAKIGTAHNTPYNGTLDTTGLTTCSSHAITAKSFDRYQNSRISSVATVTIATNTPGDGNVTWTQPAQCSTISGSSVNLTVSAILDRHEYTYKYYLDGSSTPFTTKLCIETGCTVIWNSTSVADGAHTFKVVAVDSKGLIVGYSSVLTAIVKNTVPPTVSITEPTTGSTVSGAVVINATADGVGVDSCAPVSKVEFWKGFTIFEDAIKLGEDTTSPYSYTWYTTSADNGSHQLTAKAFNSCGISATSAAVTVNVANTITDGGSSGGGGGGSSGGGTPYIVPVD